MGITIDDLRAMPAMQDAPQAAKVDLTQRARECFESRIDVVKRMIIDYARSRRLTSVSKRMVRSHLIEDEQLGLSYSERSYVFECAWSKAVCTTRRALIDDLDNPMANPLWRIRDRNQSAVRRRYRPSGRVA